MVLLYVYMLYMYLLTIHILISQNLYTSVCHNLFMTIIFAEVILLFRA
jgi:hypothetical protein